MQDILTAGIVKREDPHASRGLHCEPGGGRNPGNGRSYPGKTFYDDGEAGTGKTTDARMIAQILGLPYYVFTCGPGTDELELLASTVPNMGTKTKRFQCFQSLRPSDGSSFRTLCT